MARKRNYRKEYDQNDSQPKEKKKRAQRNKARRLAIKAGKARKGDGKDVAHKDDNTKNSSESNLESQSQKKNRSFPRDKGAKRKKGTFGKSKTKAKKRKK